MKRSAVSLQLSALLILTACASTTKPANLTGIQEPWKEYSIEVAGTKRTYELVWPNNGRRPLPVLFFLHGLDGDQPNPQQTLLHYRFLAERANAVGFMAVFPRGLRGAYPQLPESLGWIGDPAKEKANRDFLLALVSELSKRYAIDKDRVVLGGFSNGGYLASRGLLLHPDSPFTAFWVEAAGTFDKLPEFVSRAKKSPVYIALAKEDWNNFPKGKDLIVRLISAGWQADKSLKVNEHAGGHALDQQGFSAAWSFLAARNS